MEELSEKTENNQVNQQEINKQENKSTLLRMVSIVFMWFSFLLVFIGLAWIIAGIDTKEEEPLYIGIAILIGGLFTLFAGCIGEAIDDIRTSLKK